MRVDDVGQFFGRALHLQGHTDSAISSVAVGPMMCTPRISPYFCSVTIFTKPSCWPTMLARELAVKGNLPTFTS